VIYLVVRRTIGAETVRYIEFVKPRSFVDLEHSFCVDSGLTYEGVPADEIAGLDHLEGETVAVLADGLPLTAVVTAGVITLDDEASVVTVGLPYNCDLVTPPLSYRAAAAGMEQQENISGVRLRVKETSGLSVGPSFDDLKDFIIPTWETPGLQSGLIETASEFGWDEDNKVYIRQANPLPAMITAMCVDYAEAD
jgi:hypothetical protein